MQKIELNHYAVDQSPRNEDESEVIMHANYTIARKSPWVIFRYILLLFFAILFTTSLYFNFIMTKKLYYPTNNLKVNPPPMEKMSVITTPYDESLGFLPNDQTIEYCKSYRYDVYTPRTKRRKVYDLTLVNTELDMLEVRLGSMWDHVDYFVLVEAEQTYSGNPKPEYLKENWDRYKKYHSKMIRHTLNVGHLTFENAWHREWVIRKKAFYDVFMNLQGAEKPEQGDVIIGADLDEIPKSKTLIALRNCNFPKVVTLRSGFFFYSFQFKYMGEEWAFPHATYYDGNDTISTNTMKDEGSEHNIWNAGWHCSYCFRDMSEIVKKIESFSHQEYNNDKSKNRKTILHRVRNGIDLYGSPTSQYLFIPDNTDIPEFLLNAENRERFKFMVDRDPPSANFEDYTPADSEL